MRSCAFMRSRETGTAIVSRDHRRVHAVVASHNHSACRNASRAFGGRYFAGLTSGGFKRAKARSFIARSASTYMCVVDGLSCPSHKAISHGVGSRLKQAHCGGVPNQVRRHRHAGQVGVLVRDATCTASFRR